MIKILGLRSAAAAMEVNTTAAIVSSEWRAADAMALVHHQPQQPALARRVLRLRLPPVRLSEASSYHFFPEPLMLN